MTAFASDLSYLVLQRRQHVGELHVNLRQSAHRRLYRAGARWSFFCPFLADPDMGNIAGTVDSDDTEQVRLSQRRRRG